MLDVDIRIRFDGNEGEYCCSFAVHCIVYRAGEHHDRRSPRTFTYRTLNASARNPEDRKRTVLVTDPAQRSCLAAVRSLARSGFRVLTFGRDKGLAGHSRATIAHVMMAPKADAQAATYRVAVQAAVAAYGVDVILPITDRSSRALIGFDAMLGAVVAGPSAAAYDRASNKVLLAAVAPEVGICIPQFTLLKSPEELDVLRAALRFPLVCKPQQSVVDAEDGTVSSTAVSFVESAALLEATVSKYSRAAYPLMLQQRVAGVGVGVFLLRRRGQTLLHFGHRRLREKPPAGGVSTYRESMEPPLRLRQQCEQLLDKIGFEGAAMIEFKHDDHSDEYFLMEINARLWGSVQLAVDAGVDFPTALVRSSLGEPLARTDHASRKTMRLYWELGELDHALAMLRRTPAELHLPADTRTGIGAAIGALLNRRVFQDRAEVFRFSDPMPFFHELGRWVRGR